MRTNRFEVSLPLKLNFLSTLSTYQPSDSVSQNYPSKHISHLFYSKSLNKSSEFDPPLIGDAELMPAFFKDIYTVPFDNKVWDHTAKNGDKLESMSWATWGNQDSLGLGVDPIYNESSILCHCIVTLFDSAQFLDFFSQELFCIIH